MAEQIASPDYGKIYLASGYVHPQLAEDTAKEMGIELGPVERRTFPNSELYGRFAESVRGRDVFIIQSHAATPDGRSVNDAIMEQLLMANAARGSSAREVTVVFPYLGYSRQDRRATGREPISVQAVIDSFAAMGVRRIVAIDLHSPQTQAIFRGPFDHLTAQPDLRDKVRERIAGVPEGLCVVVAPDIGSVAMGEYHRRELDVDLVPMSKIREKGSSGKITRAQRVDGVEDKVCIVLDDMIDTAGTLLTAAEVLHNSGASRIIVGATHGILSSGAAERIRDSPIDELILTDTLPLAEAQKVLGDKLQVVSVAPMLARALIEIVTEGSVSKLFHGQNYR